MVKELETEHKMGKIFKCKRIWIHCVKTIKQETFENTTKLKRA